MKIVPVLKNFTFLLFLPVLAFAQSSSIPSEIPELDQQISVNVSNDFPKPLETVNISLEAYGTDLNRAKITWSVNGITTKSGVGEIRFSTGAGKLGETKRVGILIQPVIGSPINKTVVLSPQETDLLWEARTYTPPFYKGKAMYSPQENVVVVAMPNFIGTNGAKMDSSKLIYKWSLDGEAEQDQSGYGQSVYSIKGGILLKQNQIGVEVTSSGKERAKESVDLKVTFPETLFYENNPLYGILFNRALNGTYYFTEEEKNIEAFPYFFGVFRRNDSSLSYDWRINNNNINVSKGTNSMVFRNTEKEEGTSLIGLTISNTSNFLEESQGSVNLNYSASKSNFGF